MSDKVAKKRRSERIRNRKATVFQKAFELGEFPEIEIAVIIYQNGQYFTYNSTANNSWPPSMKEIVSQATSFVVLS